MNIKLYELGMLWLIARLLSSCLLQNGGTSTISGQYNIHQAKGDASLGSRKSGYLNKRSEGRLRNVWQKRKCQVREGYLEIYHADESKAPTQVNLLTCQMKPVGGTDDNNRPCCFDVVSYNRTYHFQVSRQAPPLLLHFDLSFF